MSANKTKLSELEQAATGCTWPNDLALPLPKGVAALLQSMQAEQSPALPALSSEAAALARHHNQLRAFIEVVAGKPLSRYQAELLESLLRNAPGAQSTSN